MNPIRYLRLFPFILLFAAAIAHGQTATITGRLVDAAEEVPLTGATIRIAETEQGAIADADGRFSFTVAAPGHYSLGITYVGYNRLDTAIDVEPGDTILLMLAMGFSESEEEEEEIVVTGTRTERTISDVPVQIEVVPQEEVEEKIMMSPSSVSTLLNESTGMRVQTTSPTAGTANLRIQGLPGRYTQILTDGIPNVGGLSAGFSLTELPPLNLRQVEIIKGAASALYGADAISGVVNFITKDPRPEGELSGLVNYTSLGGFDAAVFAGKEFTDPVDQYAVQETSNHVGGTVLASVNLQPRNDRDGDGFADVTEFERFSLYPKIIYDAGRMQIDVALGLLNDKRLGGAVDAPESGIGAGAPYLESIESRRLSGTVRGRWLIGEEDNALTITGAAMDLRRDAIYGSRPFNAQQLVVYGEAQYVSEPFDDLTSVIGGSVNLDEFTDETPDVPYDRSYRYFSPALFASEELNLTEEWRLLATGRLDFHSDYGTFFTPRLSVMFKPTENLTTRLGWGTGFKAPTIFVEEAEERGFVNTRLAEGIDAEAAQSGSFDLNWRTLIGDEVGLHFNAVAYLTRMKRAVIADPDSLDAGSVFLRNATGSTLTRGFELSTKTSYADFLLSLGYTYIYATQEDRSSTYELPLNPRHALGCVLMWENEDLGTRVGFEAYWTGRQRLEDHPSRTQSPSYWITGLLMEKAFGPLRVFLNFENFTDTRQTRYEPVIVGDPLDGPIRTLPIYAPLEGRVINGGLRVVL